MTALDAAIKSLNEKYDSISESVESIQEAVSSIEEFGQGSAAGWSALINAGNYTGNMSITMSDNTSVESGLITATNQQTSTTQQTTSSSY